MAHIGIEQIVYQLGTLALKTDESITAKLFYRTQSPRES